MSVPRLEEIGQEVFQTHGSLELPPLCISVRSSTATTSKNSVSALLCRLGCSGAIYYGEFVCKRTDADMSMPDRV